MQALGEDSGHGQQPTSEITGRALWNTDGMLCRYLVARLHVDLQRVSSAVCSAR